MLSNEKFEVKNPGTLMIIIGLPGSGKSTYIEKFREKHTSCSTYDDYQGGALGDDPDPRLSKHYSFLVRDLKDGRTVLVSDVRYCIPSELNAFLSAVVGTAPNTILVFKYFENNPELCKQNVMSRNREGRVERELELIDNLSSNYYPLGLEVIPIHPSPDE